MSDDKEVLALAKYADERKEEVDIYVQHVSSHPEVVHFISGGGLEEEVGQDDVLGEAEMVIEDDVVGEAEVMGEVEVGVRKMC